MAAGHNEAFSRVLIDKALEASGWSLLDPQQIQFELNTSSGRADYLLKDSIGRVLCVLEAKREDLDPYDAKEQARGYAENLNAPFVLLSNGREHWFWNYERADQRDAYRIERLPSREDLERVRLKNLQPPRPLQTEVIRPEYLRPLRADLTLRGYQIRAMDEIAKRYDETGRRRFLLEMATGTGKTLLCAALIRRFLVTRNAERVLFIVDRIELAKQTMEDFNVVLGEYKPVIYKTARRTGELLGSSVVVATIQSLMTDRRYREEFTPFYFDLVINDEAHRSIYGDAREAVQFFQATRIGLTATPKAYLKNVNLEHLATEDPKSLEARQLRDTYHYFGCEPGQPTFRYDITDAVKDPEGPFLCLPKIVDCRSDITTQALQEAGWTVLINEQEENFKIQDLERKIFTPHRNRVMCEAFLREAQRDPNGDIGKSIIFAVNQTHATALTKTLNEIKPGIALTITSRIPDASSFAKEFRDGKRAERIAVSVDMLSTGYNCRDLLNVVLMRPVFSPTEYIQIKGRGTRRFTFVVGNTEYVHFLEEAHDIIADYDVPGFEDFYRRLLRDALRKFNLRYRLDEPFTLRFLLPGSFSNLYEELHRVNVGNGHLVGLLNDFEKAFDRYARTQDPTDLKTCIAKASNYAEGLASSTHGTAGTLGALCDQLTDWPHDKVKDALKNLYKYCSDYPGIRHAGNPAGVRRDLTTRDMTLASLLLLSFSGYLTRQIDEHVVLGA
jgi:type I restriction enzyme R subunit